MRTILGTCLMLLCAWPAVPQEGHPLSGTWTGDAGFNATDRKHITIVMNWDGKAISGLVNPGPDSAPLKNVTLDPSSWTVRLEFQSGQTATVGEGKIENLGSIHRTIKGTWKANGLTGDFRLTRD